MMGIKMLKNKLNIFKKIVEYSVSTDKNRKKILILGFIVGILKEGTILARTLFPAFLVNIIFFRERLHLPIIIATCVSFLLSISDFIIESFSRKISNLSVSSISFKLLALNKKYMSMKYDNLLKTKSYNTYNRATDAVWEINDTEFVIYSNLLPKCIGLISLIGIFLNIDIIIALIICVSVVLELILEEKKDKQDIKSRESISETRRKFSHLLSNLFDPVFCRDLQAYNSEDLFSKQIEEFRMDHIFSIKECEKKKLMYSIISTISTYMRMILVYILAILKFFRGNLLLSNFLVFINASDTLLNSLRQIKYDILFFNRVISYFEDIQSFLMCEEKLLPVRPSGLDQNNDVKLIVPIIEFKEVSFTYPNQGKKTIDNVSFKIYQNEKIAFVGENGSGKSTIVNLLLKLYKPDDGTILINGKDINEIDDEEYFKLFAPVFQDFNILSYTIRDNIAFAKDSDTKDSDNRINDLLYKVNLYDKVFSLPRGLDTFYTTRFDEFGVEFSGGEKQLLAIARALFKDSTIIVLDEPTSSIDPMREKDIFITFSKCTQNKTTLLISHRMSACRTADNIFFLKEGKICEYGNHDFLLKKCGEYAQLWNMQSQWYK